MTPRPGLYKITRNVPLFVRKIEGEKSLYIVIIGPDGRIQGLSGSVNLSAPLLILEEEFVSINTGGCFIVRSWVEDRRSSLFLSSCYGTLYERGGAFVATSSETGYFVIITSDLLIYVDIGVSPVQEEVTIEDECVHIIRGEKDILITLRSPKKIDIGLRDILMSNKELPVCLWAIISDYCDVALVTETR